MRKSWVPDWALFLLLSSVYDAPIDCDYCAEWNRPQAPFHIFGNTYYVGPGGLSSILIEMADGLVLLDGGLPQSAAVIADNIRTLGFDPADIKLIGLSHAHYDHAGGIAALQRISGAMVVASHDAARALRRGALQEDDPQFGGDMTGQTFPAVEEVLGAADGWTFKLPGLELTAWLTVGHTRGGMSWTWQSCEEGRCLNVAYIDSMSPVSRPGFRFSDGLGDILRETLGRIESFDCDIMLSTHDFSFGLHGKLEQGREAFIDPDGCRKLAQKTSTYLDVRLKSEQP